MLAPVVCACVRACVRACVCVQLLFPYNSVHVLVYRDQFQVQISLASLQISLEQVSPTSALQFCNVYKYTDIFRNSFVSKSYFELELEEPDSIGTKIQLNPACTCY